MATWNEIRENFTEWLKTQGTEYQDNEAHIAHIKYSEQFKLFITNHDGDENLNMDSFIKRKDFDNVLLNDMVVDYVNNIDKNSKEFKAVDTDGDGKISVEEKNIFLDKVMEAGFDGDAENISFEDITTSFEKIAKGEFLNENAGVAGADGGNADADAGAVADAGGNNKNNNNGTTPLTLEEAKSLNNALKNYKPDLARATGIKIEEINAALINNSYDDVNNKTELESTRGSIVSDIEGARADFYAYSEQYNAANDAYVQSASYIERNESQYNDVIAELAKNNENVRIANEQVQTYETAIAATTQMITTLCATKDSLNASLTAATSQLGSLKEIPATDTNGDPIEGAEEHNAEVRAERQRLQEEIKRLQEELLDVSNLLLEHEEVLNQANESLQEAYTNLENSLAAVEFNSDTENELVAAVLNNKKKYIQALCDRTRAQAGMAAMDAYIIGLSQELDEIDNRMAELEGQEEGEGEETGKNYDDYKPDFPEGEILGLVEPNANGTATPTWEDDKIVGYIYKTDEYTITVTYDEETRMPIYTRDYGNDGTADDTLTILKDGNMKYGTKDFPEYYVQDGKTITTKIGDETYSSAKNGENRTITMKSGQYSQTITTDEDGNLVKFVETDAEGRTVKDVTVKDGKTTTKEYKYGEDGEIEHTTTTEQYKNDDVTVTEYERKYSDGRTIKKDNDDNWTYTNKPEGEDEVKINYTDKNISSSQAQELFEAAQEAVKEGKTTFTHDGKEYEMKYENGAWVVTEKTVEEEPEPTEPEPTELELTGPAVKV